MSESSPRWTREQFQDMLHAVVSGLDFGPEAVDRMVEWLDLWSPYLPPFAVERYLEIARIRYFRDPAVLRISFDQLYGDGWLFEDPSRWNKEEQSLTRLAHLLLVKHPEAILAILDRDPPDVIMLGRRRFHADGWYRRIYTAWALGCTEIPVRVIGRARHVRLGSA